MCRILFKKNNSVKFDEKELEVSLMTNPDGTGLIYYDIESQKLLVHKFLKGTPFTEIYKKIEEIENLKNISNFGIHFRIGTSGGKSLEQIHPISVKEDMWIMHNGICREFDMGNGMSDTQWIAQYFRENNFRISDLDNEATKKKYEEIFHSNKILVLEKDKFNFINDDLGTWDNGIWKSWKKGSLYGWDNNYSKEDESIFDFFKPEKTENNNLEKQVANIGKNRKF